MDADVLIVGAGLSGIGAACRLRSEFPGKRIVVLEARDRLGGTWDQFRYPGVRADSDMFTLCYPFRPWAEPAAIVDGPRILQYLEETAAAFGVEGWIRFGHRAQVAAWSSAEGCWTVDTALPGGGTSRLRAAFVYLCTGYFSYRDGYLPAFPGAAEFGGRLVHPQHWPTDLDYRGKRVVIVGSGATAISLAPAMAAEADGVTVLQRSPGYVLARPAVETWAGVLQSLLPASVAYRILRWKNVALGTGLYQLCRRAPGLARRLLWAGGPGRVSPDGELRAAFTPSYDPWDQRLCVAPDGDLFDAVASGRVRIVTDEVRHLDRCGIVLGSGRRLDAEVIVAATGLELLAWGGIEVRVDGVTVEASQSFVYRGYLVGGVPNLAVAIGYTNASWTLRADLSARLVCRLLRRMERTGAGRAVVPPTDPGVPRPLIDLAAGYVARGGGRLPRQGSKGPWRLRQNYLLDVITSTLAGPGRGVRLLPPPVGARSQAPAGPHGARR